MVGASPTSAPPDWNTFTLDLSCPRCGYNLRTLTGCRCPECGLELDWERIITSAQNRVDSPLFEYHWRTRPVRSYLTSIRYCLRPKRLWNELALADDPRTAGLAIFAIATAALFLLLAALGKYEVTISYSYGRILWSPQVTLQSVLWASRQLAFIVANIFTAWLYLQLFQQTIARHSIRQVHIFRLIVLAAVPILLIKVVINLIVSALDANFNFYWRYPFFRVGLSAAAECLAVAAFVLSLMWGLSAYLKLEHGRWVAVSVSLLTLLTWFAILVLFSIFACSWHNPLTHWANSAWPGLGDGLVRLLLL